MPLPLISILIANYNNGRFFPDCHASLLKQTEQNWEAIIIDDSSTDDSATVIANLINGDPRFRFFRNPDNVGYQRTLARAIALSSAPVFGRLDPDDALTQLALEASLAAHLKHPAAGLSYSNFIRCDEFLNPIDVHYCKQVTELDSKYYNFKGEISHFATFKRTIYDRTTGIDIYNRRAEDKDIYMKMCEVAPVKHIDESLYLYRVHSGGISSAKHTDKAVFWHWVAMIKMAERRGLNIEQEFVNYYLPRERVTPLKRSRILRFLNRLGFVRGYRNL
jgi:glycosyltransferase involved in cell wall biosynthesis